MISTADLPLIARRAFPEGRCVHEPGPRYDDEGSVRQAHGAVALPGDAWWSAVLAAPIGEAGAGAAVTLRLERHGPVTGATPGDASITLVVSAGEVDAVVALLAGVVAQARRDGVLGEPGRT